jgi:hypothetical protein
MDAGRYEFDSSILPCWSFGRCNMGVDILFDVSAPQDAVPEPSTLLLLSAGTG